MTGMDEMGFVVVVAAAAAADFLVHDNHDTDRRVIDDEDFVALVVDRSEDFRATWRSEVVVAVLKP